MSALTEPVHRAIATRLRRGQSADQLYSVGERTGWWTGDDVDWATSGGEGPRPDGWTLDAAEPTPQPQVDWEYRDGQWREPATAQDNETDNDLVTTATTTPPPATETAGQDGDHAVNETDTNPPTNPATGPLEDTETTLHGFVTGVTVREAIASVALDGDTQVIEGPVTVVAPVTVDVGEVAPTGSYVGIVPVDQVFADSHYQRPLQKTRAAAMAKTWNPRMVAVIDVSDRGEHTLGRRYAVVNGQHRWAAAQMAGVTQFAATIHEGLDRAGEARLMYELDRGTKPLTSWDKWRARLAAGDEHATTVQAIAAQHGMTTAPSSFGAPGAAETILRRDGRQHLATTVLLLTEAWGTTAGAVKAPALLGMATVLRAGIPDVQRMVDALRATSPQQVRARADAMRDLDGGTLNALTARAMATAYNNRPGPKLVLS